MESELKPCPFCGGIDLQMPFKFSSDGLHTAPYCNTCGWNGGFVSVEQAVTAWNTRQADTTLERVKEMAREMRMMANVWSDPETKVEVSVERSYRKVVSLIEERFPEILEGESKETG